MRFKDAIYNLNNNVSQPGIYAIPSELSMNSPQVPWKPGSRIWTLYPLGSV